MSAILVIRNSSDVWMPPVTWLSDAQTVGILVMSGEILIPAPTGTMRLSACTAAFLPNRQVAGLRLLKADAIIWLVADADAAEIGLNRLQQIDEVDATIIHDVFFEHKRPDAHQQVALSLICHQLRNQHRDADTSATPTGLVASVLAYMQSHLDDSITFTILEHHFDCSRDVLTKRFRKEQGETPIRALARLRLEHARHLLQNTELTVSQIAHAIGYQDLAGFSHFFKKHAGHSPSEFRSNCQWLG